MIHSDKLIFVGTVRGVGGEADIVRLEYWQFKETTIKGVSSRNMDGVKRWKPLNRFYLIGSHAIWQMQE